MTRAALIRLLYAPDDVVAGGEPDPGEPTVDLVDPADPAAEADPADATNPEDEADTEPTELDRAQRALAAERRARQRLEREQQNAKRAADEEAGKWKELYDQERERNDKLEQDHRVDKARGLVDAELRKLDPVTKNVGRLVAMIDLDDVDPDDPVSAERLAKRLKREEPDLFRAPQRQVRNGGDRGGTSNGSGSAGTADDADLSGPEILRRAIASGSKT
jgi:hypothetical protein